MSELKSKEVPMLFKAQMVNALMRTLNPKTETRRIADQNGASKLHNNGDLIWVKETWRPRIAHSCIMDACDCGDVEVGYIADNKTIFFADSEIDSDWLTPKAAQNGNNVPSLFMPRWASRILLEVIEDSHVERLQDISEKSALAEGFIKLPATGRVVEFEGAQYFGAYWPNARAAYRDLWNNINLTPKPLSKNKEVVGYTSYPWSNADFDAEYPGIRESSLYRGKPITVTENPWVTVTTFKLKELRA